MPGTTISVGNVEITAVHDGDGALPISMVFPGVDPELWLPYQQKYPECFNGDNNENIALPFECYVIRSEGHTILVDTGVGSMATNPGTVTAFAGGVDGRLLLDLQTAGVNKEDIDTVFLTHLHPDHVGWNVNNDGPTPVPSFPNARYVFHQDDWEAFRPPRDSEVFGFTFWEETLAPLEGAGVIEPLSGEHSITSEITAILTPGHTPGSMSLAIDSGGEKALVMGDVFHGPPQVSEPSWVFAFDADPDTAVQSRSRMLDRAEAENAIMAICHSTGFGRVVSQEGRRYWQGL
ncbi:MAG: MBL fold metallo-hydrolase [Pseudomonadales bacterium]|jgi:glyoxylase-like metal-dependent hydrolase (beta-lactamase superfamily II)|nr:MBL fold metallo-hydrolase [Pseudomonadales bacterium]MCH2519949.1 MBL fold metallo-hydrolase [Dehalococcoidia bacterium]|tara:strand:+ start:127 stop:999 length:873 start_codon:yes stop_codon:yes gene_type:complete